MTPYLDPANQAFIDAGAKDSGPPLYERSFVDARAFLETVQQHDPAPDVSIEEFDAPVGPSGKVKTVIFKPKGAGGHLGTIFYTHGGGWVLGSPNTHGRLMEDLVRESGCAVVFPYYTPAPDAQYPVQFEETFAVLQYICANVAKHGLKTDKIALAGDSAGGDMTIALTHLSATRGPFPHSTKIAHLALFYPVTDFAHESSTFTTFADGPYLSVPLLKWMEYSFMPKTEDRNTPLGSPLTAMSDADLKVFPPTTLVPADVDPLREEGEQFGYRLLGVECAVLLAKGCIHDYCMLNGPAKSATSIAVVELCGLKIKKALA